MHFSSPRQPHAMRRVRCHARPAGRPGVCFWSAWVRTVDFGGLQACKTNGVLCSVLRTQHNHRSNNNLRTPATCAFARIVASGDQAEKGSESARVDDRRVRGRHAPAPFAAAIPRGGGPARRAFPTVQAQGTGGAPGRQPAAPSLQLSLAPPQIPRTDGGIGAPTQNCKRSFHSLAPSRPASK